ncbi:MAG: ABC transporter permease [Acutalibacteraceae bacterium]|nr:ABC transporter permease [Clostridia bacterium]MEE3404211.1 ABC transporter permease [Acutalibacteraceae bacterium]
MKHILQVLRFEYSGCVKTKSFIISTAIFMALILLMAFLPGIILSAMSSDQGEEPTGDEKKPVIAVCDNTYHEDELVKQQLALYYPNNDIKMTTEDIAALQDKVDSQEYAFAVVLNEPLSCTYITKNNSVFSTNNSQLTDALTKLYQVMQLEKAGVSPEDSLNIIHARMKMDTITTGTDQGQNYWSTYVLMMILYIAVVMYGQMVSQNVVAEKNTRAMEMLITCAKPTHLMFGKVIGSGLAGLTQMLLIISTALVSMNTVSKDSLPAQIKDMLSFPMQTVLFALVFFILGYFIYSFLLGALASLASRSEDLNTLISPVMMVYVAAFLVVMLAMSSDNINGTLMIVCSYIPFTAPLAMFTRIAMSDVALWEILLSIAVQLASVYLFGRLAAAIYRIGVLMYGNAPKPTEIIKLLREQHRSNKALKAAAKQS